MPRSNVEPGQVGTLGGGLSEACVLQALQPAHLQILQVY